jgi:hypothetical protein
MRFKDDLKRVSRILLTLILLLSATVFAEGLEIDIVQGEHVTVIPQPPQQSTPIATLEKTVAGQATDEATPPPESTAPSADKDDDEADMDSPPETDGQHTPSPTEDKADEIAEDDIDEDDPAEPQPERIAVSISLKWDISAEDGLLRVGDPITLTVEITSEADNLGFQWQAATKHAQALRMLKGFSPTFCFFSTCDIIPDENVHHKEEPYV